MGTWLLGGVGGRVSQVCWGEKKCVPTCGPNSKPLNKSISLRDWE